MKFIVLLIFLSVQVHLTIGQVDLTQYYVSKIQPPPNAALLGKYGSNPVNYYNGTATVSIPLFNMQSGDLKFTSNLSYTTGGIQVEQEASSVGLGWVLNCGGLITREIRSHPDVACKNNSWNGHSAKKPPFAHDKDIATFSGTYNGLWGWEDELFRQQDEYDYDPDIFHFNFGNYSGSFILTHQNVTEGIIYGKTLDLAPLRIEYRDIDGNQSQHTYYKKEFKIIDAQGVEYQFAQKEISVPASNRYPTAGIPGSDQGTDSFFENGPYSADYDAWAELQSTQNEYISSWYLTKIISPVQGQIEFVYSASGNPHSRLIQTTRSQSFANLVGLFLPSVEVSGTCWLGSGPNPVVPYSGTFPHSTQFYGSDFGVHCVTSLKAYDEVQLQAINGDNWSIKFHISTREDITNFLYSETRTQKAHKIDRIELFVKDAANLKFEKGFRFSYSYFDAGSGQGVNNEDRKRLKLDAVTEYSTESDKPPHTFLYNTSASICPKSSFQRDYWGYRNNNSVASLLGPRPQFPSGCTECSSTLLKTYLEANRQAHAPSALMAILTEVIYPTGGKSTFEYELNEYLNDDLTTSTGGGLRVKKMIDSPSPYVSYETNYSYNKDGQTSGILTTPFVNSYYEKVCAYAKSLAPYIGAPFIISPMAWATIMHLESNTLLSSIGRGSSGIIGYSHVTITNQNSKTEIKYNNEPDDPVNYSSYPGAYALYYGYVLPGITSSKNVLNGKPTEISYYVSGTKKLTRTYEYDILQSDVLQGTFTFASCILIYNPACNATVGMPGYNFRKFDIPQLWSECSSLTETSYEGSLSHTKKTTFEYSNQLNHLKTAETSSAQDKSGRYVFNKSIYTFSADYPPSITACSSATDANDILHCRNMLSSPVSVAKYIATNTTASIPATGSFQATQGSHLKYDVVFGSNGTPVPVELKTFHNDAPGPAPGSFTAPAYTTEALLDYDASLNVVNLQPAHKPNESYQWGYGNTYPIAKATGVGPDKFLYTGFEDNTPGSWQVLNWGTYLSLAKTGRYAFSGTLSTPNTFAPAGSYELSFWMKGNAVTVSGSITTPQGASYTTAASPGEWKLVRIPISSITGSFSIDAVNTQIDEVLLTPKGAHISTYTYEPLKGLSSATDINRKPGFYRYDGLGRLIEEHDENSDVLKSYIYRYFRK